MKKIASLLFLFFIIISYAQNVTIISEISRKPLPKVTVFAKNGNILATTDNEGKFDRSAVEPKQEGYQLVYNNSVIADLNYQDFQKDIIEVNDKTRLIEQVVMKKSKPAKYIYLHGNFNSYLTINNKLNCYADGIITCIFDNKTKKLKSSRVEQYKVYVMEEAEEDRKKVATLVYDNMLDVPKLKNLSRIDELKEKKNLKYKELSGNNKDEIEFLTEVLQDKEFSLFGYRFIDLKGIISMAFEKSGPKTIKTFLEYNEIEYTKIKHISESEYNQFIAYSNFYPTELSFENEDAAEKVKFRKENSNYSTSYWDQEDFPNMLNVFIGYFGNDMKEMPNKK